MDQNPDPSCNCHQCGIKDAIIADLGRGEIGVQICLETVKLRISLRTNEPCKRVDKHKAKFKLLCLAMNLIRDVDVGLDVDWRTVPA